MAGAKTLTKRQDQASPTSPAPAQTLSSEAFLDALKMILLGAPLNEVLTSVTRRAGRWKEVKMKIEQSAEGGLTA
ncbi:MAG: hypothetical protein WAR24_17225 [Candidatus Acidiferrales bacterium]